MSLKLTRRAFLKDAAAAMVGVAALASLGSASAEQAESASVPSRPESFTDGKYVVETVGHEGKMVVVTQIRDGKIFSVEVPSYRETQGVGTYAISTVPGRIVEAQSLNVDGVAGATITSSVIKFAVAQAIEDAGGNVEDFEGEHPVMPLMEETKEIKAKVAIMGAGTAGLFCATWLLKQGMKGEDIVLFEKQDIPGGCMAMTYGGIVLAESEIYNTWVEQNGFEPPAGEAAAYTTWEKAAEFYGPVISAYNPDYNKELPYTRQMFTKSGELYDYMSGIGMGFTPLFMTPFFNYPYFAPGCYAGGSGFAMEFLVRRLTGAGVQIHYASPVTELVQDETGRVVGLVAMEKGGTTWRVSADAVMLASGSFAKNQELLDTYYPEWKDFYFNCPTSLTGDGLKLGMGCGAGIEYMGEFIPGFLATYNSHFELAFMHFSTPGIIVNVEGKQFGNIMVANHSLMSKAKADPANGDTFYYIFDDDAAASTRDYKGFNFTTYSGIFEKGEAMHFDSLEACAEALELPALAETIETNNRHAVLGEADEWGRAGLPYIETRNGVWALRVDPNVYLTTGGLKIDLDCHVLKEDGSPIAGLYAAGDVCGSVEQKDGRHYDFGFNAAMSYGAIAAETICKEL